MDHVSEFSKQPHEEVIIIIIILVIAGRAGEGGKAGETGERSSCLPKLMQLMNGARTPMLLIPWNPLPTISIRLQSACPTQTPGPGPGADAGMGARLAWESGLPWGISTARKDGWESPGCLELCRNFVSLKRSFPCFLALSS